MLPVDRSLNLESADNLTALLSAAGFLSAADEAGQLIAAAHGDQATLAQFVSRRLTGEPLAWITGKTVFCAQEIRIFPGVYVPRSHSEMLAVRAAARLPKDGIAIDICAGSGAVAAVLRARKPCAEVWATEIDETAIGCARANGIEVVAGDLYSGLPSRLGGKVDVIVGIVPYVPTSELQYLQRDTFSFETALAYDGGPEGTDVLRRAIDGAPAFLRRGGVLLLELGGEEHTGVQAYLTQSGYDDIEVLVDEDGDVRGIEARRRI